jgi:putative ABC transport system permease protein
VQISVLSDEVWQTWRNLFRQPRYLALATMTLALGVGAVLAVCALLYQSLLKPLPFRDDERIVSIGMDPGGGQHIASPGILNEIAGIDAIEAMGIVSSYTRTVNLAADESPVVGELLSADHGFMETLGVRMQQGRNFTKEEDVPNGPRVGLISHSFWRDHFGAAPDVVGASVFVEGINVTVVGVLPPSFRWINEFDLIVPMRVASDSTDLDTNQHIVARLRPGTSAEALGSQTNAKIQAMLSRMRAQIGVEGYDFLSARQFDARPIRDLFAGSSQSTLWLFLCAALCVLLIASINLANLVLLRVVVRSHDSAVRTSLGATPFRLALPALSEALLVGVLGSIGGALLAWLGLRALGALAPPEWLRGEVITLEPILWGVALACGVGVALLVTVVGVWRGLSGVVSHELVGGGRSGLSRGAGRLGQGLVVAQVAVAVVLLIGAGLFVRSLYELSSVPLGFRSDGLTTFSLSPVKTLYTDVAAVKAQTDQVIRKLSESPGTEAIAAASHLPIGSRLNLPITLGDGRSVQPQFRLVTASYFDLFRIPIVSGRGIGTADNMTAEPVAVVSRAFADQFFSGGAVGQIVRMGRGADAIDQLRIVGIADDVRAFGPAEDAPPTIYIPLEQASDATWRVVREFGPLRYAIRMQSGGGLGEAGLRRSVQEVSPTQPIAEVVSMDAIVSTMTAEARLHLLLVGIFAGLALSLASVGLYAVLSVSVASREFEFGVRAALGATPPDLIKMTLRGALIQTAVGIALGGVAAMLLGAFIKRFLFGVELWDPVALFAVLLALVIASLLAALGPALRAARVDPAYSLRSM